MKIKSITATRVRLPFRFAFGHKLASRSCSENLLVKVSLANGVTGFGESIPRDYVTGETIDSAYREVLETYAPRLIGLDVSNLDWVLDLLLKEFYYHHLDELPRGASWCALETAILDALGKAHEIHVSNMLGAPKVSAVRYDGVVPFARGAKLAALLWFYKIYGFQTVKIKVGGKLADDLERLRISRAIMGDNAILRVDANCAWTAGEAIKAAHAFESFDIASIEQPLPADDLEGLAVVQAQVGQDVMVDESLCTYIQAQELINKKACRAFNIRVSKNGGILPSARLVKLADDNGIAVHMGAQVGESGILSAAGRILAVTKGPFANHEGSDNNFLLKRDLTAENLTVAPGGWGKMDVLCGPGKFGLGISVVAGVINELAIADADPLAESATTGAFGTSVV